MAELHHKQIANAIVNATLLHEDFNLDEVISGALAEIEEYSPKVETMVQAIVAYIGRHKRTEYVQRLPMSAALLGVDENDARLVTGYGGKTGYKHIDGNRGLVVNAYCFRIALELLMREGKVKYRGHGGYYLVDRGDPSEVS